MLERLLERGKTSGREDDNVESIKKRFSAYSRQEPLLSSNHEHRYICEHEHACC